MTGYLVAHFGKSLRLLVLGFRLSQRTYSIVSVSPIDKDLRLKLRLSQINYEKCQQKYNSEKLENLINQ